MESSRFALPPPFLFWWVLFCLFKKERWREGSGVLGKEGRAVPGPGLLTLPMASKALKKADFEVGQPVPFRADSSLSPKRMRLVVMGNQTHIHILEQRYLKLSVHPHPLEG